MIVVFRADVSAEAPAVARAQAVAASFAGVTGHLHTAAGGAQGIVELYLGGETEAIPEDAFAAIPEVVRTLRVADKYKILGRHRGQQQATGFDYNGVHFGQDSLTLFPGLCAVDHRANVEATFRALAGQGIVTTRAGAYKPRTSPYDFQGHKAACLPYVFELAGKYGIRVIAMEVLHERHIEEIETALDACGRATGVMLQVGTRNAQNFELLKAVGSQRELPVLYKRGMGITLEESLNACEYIAVSGNPHIVFALRGVKSLLGQPHRNLVDFAHVPAVKRMTRLPVCIDPSHAVGGRERGADGILELMHVTAQGIVAGANMVLVDFHPEPRAALCDGPQALHLDELEPFLADARLCRATYEARCRLLARCLGPTA